MKDTREVVLFFGRKKEYKAIDIAKEILERYPFIGNPVILPDSKNDNVPLFVFNENRDIQTQGNRNSITIIVSHKYFSKLDTIIFDLVDIFEGNDCDFKRIGYISSVFLSPDYVEKAKTRFLNDKYLEDITEINLSWYKELPYKYSKVNCWERVITDSKHFSDLLMQYDFNTKEEDIIELDMKHIKDFIDNSDKYVESRIDF